MKTGLRVASATLVAGRCCGRVVLAGRRTSWRPHQRRGQPAPAAVDLDNLPGSFSTTASATGCWTASPATTGRSGALPGPGARGRRTGESQAGEATPDGTVYIACGTMGHCSVAVELVKVTPDGELRLVMEREGLIEGPMADCRRAGRYGTRRRRRSI